MRGLTPDVRRSTLETSTPAGEPGEPCRALGWLGSNAAPLRAGGAKLSAQKLPVPKARDEVVVHQTDRLHVCVDDCGAHEAEAPSLEVLAELVGFTRRCRDLTHACAAADPRVAADESPAVRIEKFRTPPVSGETREHC